MSTYKKEMVDANEMFQPKRWEGKPLKFKFKFLLANYPAVAFCGFAAIVSPFLAYYKYYSYPGSRREAIKKYKPQYTVVRDDDPNIDFIKMEKERGREFFPK